MSHLDLGIEGRTAVVCGASSGLGKSCATALARAGAKVFLNARDRGRLEDTATKIAATTGAKITCIAADISTPGGRAEILRECPWADILVTNAGGPPPKGEGAHTEAQWLAALSTNMLAPIQLIDGYIEGMKDRRWGRIINITSQAVKMPLPLLGLSNGARSGLTGYISGLAREVAPFGVTINNILPGPFSTERLKAYAAKLGAGKGKSAEAMLAGFAERNPTRRIGSPDELGAWCAFIASEHSGYVTAQNFLLDGGEYPGLL
jgi:3-oxoacyl-[acyl-carrier protein] reductase